MPELARRCASAWRTQRLWRGAWETEETLNRAASRKLKTPEILDMRSYIAFLKENAADRNRLAAESLETSMRLEAQC